MRAIESSRSRAMRFRAIGWLTVTAVAAVALIAPTSSLAIEKNPTCADSGYPLSFKIDTGTLANKTYQAGDASVVTNWEGQQITLSNLSGDGQTFDWSSTKPVSLVIVKAGDDNHRFYTYAPPATSGTGLTHGQGQQGISHIDFCGATQQSAPPSSAPPSSAPPSTPPPGATTPPPGATATPTVAPTAGGATPTPTVAPTGSSASETATPDRTLPPTDILAGEAQPSPDSWRLVLVAIAGLLAGILVLTPNRRRR
jgi:hypothetical protein